jgi:hypothetical protein
VEPAERLVMESTEDGRELALAVDCCARVEALRICERSPPPPAARKFCCRLKGVVHARRSLIT